MPLFKCPDKNKASYYNKLDAIVIQYGRHKRLICKFYEIV